VRLKAFELREVGPIRHVAVSDLADVVVFAGPNGVGKTNILNALLGLARNPHPNPNAWMVVEATIDKERARWGKSSLDTRDASDAQVLRAQLQRNQRRNQFSGSFLNFDSDRAIRNVQGFSFSWDIGDPFAEDVSWDVGFSPLHNRYNDVRHSIFRLVESQRRMIAERAIKLMTEGQSQMHLDFPDVLAPFKDAFGQLLGPKQLVEANVKTQELYFISQEKKLPLDSLSSGEREVVNIVFDFLLRGATDSIVAFDEPELHLHPELSYKLLQTLSRVGQRNQFIFSTHSPEIISASLENTVVFVAAPKGDGANQAIVVDPDDQTRQALQTLGQSIGVISLGKQVVLVEGQESSLDKQTYGAILKGRFPEFVLVPVGGKDTLRSFDEVRDNVLNRTIWGVGFYMLCDRDAVNALGRESVEAHLSDRIKQLPRYHLENYFLDENVLARVFEEMEPAESPWRNPGHIRARLKSIAQSVIPYAVALNVAATIRQAVGNIDVMPKAVDSLVTADLLTKAVEARASSESIRIGAAINAAAIAALVSAEFDRLSAAVANDDPVWQVDLPGRRILHKFAGEAKMKTGRLKQLFIAKADADITFADIVDIFQQFRASATS
jgi:energy-coupling factor transporter ATP-binding protein EcfA2